MVILSYDSRYQMAIFEEEDETIRQKGLELIEIVPSECTSFEDKDIE